MQFLNVAADRDGFVDAGAVVELQRRHHAARTDVQERGAQILTGDEIDLNRLYLDAFLGQKYTHAARARRDPAAVELHGISFVDGPTAIMLPHRVADRSWGEPLSAP